MAERRMKRDFKGIWIEKEIWLNKELSCVEKCLLAEIDSLDNENHCFASNKHFSEFLGVSIPTITRGIKKLEQMGYIWVKSQRSEFGTTRQIGVIKMIRGANQNDETPTNQNDEHINTEEIINTKSIKKTNKKDSEFELFWKSYPRKENKKRAAMVYQNAKGLPPVEEHIEILESWKQSESWQKDGGKFIPHATTWIHGARWEDELPTEQVKPFDYKSLPEDLRLKWIGFDRVNGRPPKSMSELRSWVDPRPEDQR